MCRQGFKAVCRKCFGICAVRSEIYNVFSFELSFLAVPSSLAIFMTCLYSNTVEEYSLWYPVNNTHLSCCTDALRHVCQADCWCMPLWYLPLLCTLEPWPGNVCSSLKHPLVAPLETKDASWCHQCQAFDLAWRWAASWADLYTVEKLALLWEVGILHCRTSLHSPFLSHQMDICRRSAIDTVCQEPKHSPDGQFVIMYLGGNQTCTCLLWWSLCQCLKQEIIWQTKRSHSHRLQVKMSISLLIVGDLIVAQIEWSCVSCKANWLKMFSE